MGENQGGSRTESEPPLAPTLLDKVGPKNPKCFLLFDLFVFVFLLVFVRSQSPPCTRVGPKSPEGFLRFNLFVFVFLLVFVFYICRKKYREAPRWTGRPKKVSFTYLLPCLIYLSLLVEICLAINRKLSRGSCCLDLYLYLF